MPLPKSFLTDGFTDHNESRKRRFLPGLRRPGIMIGTEGETNTGKTEFMLSCPGPGIMLVLDRNIDGVLDNPHPPESRREDFAFKEVKMSMAGMAEDHKKNWADYRDDLTKACNNKDARTVCTDCDSDSWELQRLAAFGKLTQILPIMYTEVNAARRALYARIYDSGKIYVGSNKLKAEYVVKRDAEGNPVLKDGKEIRERSGNLIRQGFDDQDYLWSIQIRHLCKDAHIAKRLIKGKLEEVEVPMRWGIRVLKCKANPSIKGQELWGADCNFAGLIQLAYPDVELAEWGL